MSDANQSIVLEVRGATKKFGGLTALSDVNLTIRQGQIYGLIGPNGAGKTTFFNVLTGMYQPDGGEFKLAGKAYDPSAPHLVAQAGIARTFQNIRLFGEMTALENVMVGRHTRTVAGFLGAVLRSPAQRREEEEIKARAFDLLAYVGLSQYADYQARNLSYGIQRRLEIARALATDPKLLALDEPAAGMNSGEKRELGELLHKIQKDGTTVLLIEHDVRLVMELCDRMTVLNFGQLLVEGEPQAVRNDPKVIEAWLGEE